MPKHKSALSTKSQSQRQKFVEAARNAGCSEDETAFDQSLRKIAKAKVAEPKAKGKKR